MTQISRAFDDQTLARNSTGPERANVYSASATYPHLQLPSIPPLYVPHQHINFWPFDPPPPAHHDGSNFLPITHPSYSLMPVGNDHRALVFPQPFDRHNPSGSFQSSPNLLFSSAYENPPPAAYHSTLDPTLHSNFPCQRSPWSAEDIQVGSVNEYFPAPSHYHSSIPPQRSLGTSSHTPGDSLLEPYHGMVGASYPCQWTENSIICNVMVQATRSHINRHLHTNHGFGGSDTQQTRCRWGRCGETMQQGSIARHMVTCHLQAKVTCPMCFKKLSRQDVISKHQRVCPAAGAWR